MSNRHELLSKALAERVRDLCSLVAQIVPAEFGHMSGFVFDVKRRIVGTTQALNRLQPPTDWLDSDYDCLSSLQRLALREPLDIRTGRRPPFERFLRELYSTPGESERRFQLLTQRYSCPLNFSFSPESDAREHVLERLMVQNRARIEKNSKAFNQSSDLLLRLNLIAVHALSTSDLRFLDALNYYYELIPSNWRPQTQHDWLLVSYFALYARALTAWEK
jgi:hypothetical protein